MRLLLLLLLWLVCGGAVVAADVARMYEETGE